MWHYSCSSFDGNLADIWKFWSFGNKQKTTDDKTNICNAIKWSVWRKYFAITEWVVNLVENPEYITLGVYKSFHKIFIGQGHLRRREQSLVFIWKFILAILMKSKQFFGSCHHSLYCKQYDTASQFQNIYIAYFIKIFTLNLLSNVIHISVNVLKKGRFKTNIWYS